MNPSSFSGRGCGDTRMWEMYAEYGDIASSEETSGKIKARLSALSAFAESQGLTGSAALEGLRRLKTDLSWELAVSTHFALFYGFVFFICRERGQKSLAVSTAVDAWKLSLAGRFGLLEQWCSFVLKHQRHAISEDTWRQLLEFSQSVNGDLSNYDPAGAWPVLVDDFVDSVQRKVSCDTNRLCPGIEEIDVSGSLGGRGQLNGAPSPGNPSVADGMVGTSHARSIKRRWSDSRSDASIDDVESVNCIAQRLAEMSYKRLRTGPAVSVAEAMEGVIDAGTCGEDEPMEVPVVMAPGNGSLQGLSRGWSAGLENIQDVLPWPSLGCASGNFPGSHSMVASCCGQFLEP